jgi:hypothetical protein
MGCTHLLALTHANNWVNLGFFFRGMKAYTQSRYGFPYLPYRDDELPDIILLSRGRSSDIAGWLPRYYDRRPRDILSTQSIVVWEKRDQPLDVAPQELYESLLKRGPR